MNKSESIEDFYKEKLNGVPENLWKGIGHFNVFRLDEYMGCNAKPIPYSRRDFYKISLIKGRNKVHYADKSITIDRQALLFANPLIPYSWEQLDEEQTGFFCVFTEAFFHQFNQLKDYPVFKPNGTPILVVDDEQAKHFSAVFEKMFVEIQSDYAWKYDVLRNLVFDLIHSALKIQPIPATVQPHKNGAERISSLFLELLERQFPIENPTQRVRLRSASDFAGQLAVHVNHLNRSLKEVARKTTSDIIAERLLREAQALLKHTNWNISEIAYCLGFEEPAHFNHFFKDKTRLSPSGFRNV